MFSLFSLKPISAKFAEENSPKNGHYFFILYMLTNVTLAINVRQSLIEKSIKFVTRKRVAKLLLLTTARCVAKSPPLHFDYNNIRQNIWTRSTIHNDR